MLKDHLGGAPWPSMLIRIMVGGVFLSEGIQKFLYPAEVGSGRFARIGIHSPELMANVVGGLEIAAGAMVLFGWAVRLAVLPLLGIMVVAFLTTKLPILIGSDLGPFRVRQLPYYGWWGLLHEGRTDFAMTLGSLYLLAVGAGPWSLDAMRDRRRTERMEPPRPDGG